MGADANPRIVGENPAQRNPSHFTKSPQNARWPWAMAAVAHESLDLKDSDEVPIAELMRRQCVLMLQSAIANGLSKPESIQSNPAFEHMRTRTDFLELLSATKVNDPETKE